MPKTLMFILMVTVVGVLLPIKGWGESNLPGTVVNAPARIDNAANLAAGNDNKAAQASVVMKNAKIGGTVVNSGKSQGAANIAIGNKNLANQGSVIIARGSIEGGVGNNATTQGAINMAVGSGNKADQAGIRLEGAKIRGAVTNNAVLHNSVNLAAGKNNSASQGAVVMEGTKLRGVVSNSATGDNSANLAIGHKNEASQSSIVIDGGGTGTALPGASFASAAHGGEKGNLPALTSSGGNEAMLEKPSKAAQHVPGQVVFLVGNDQAGLQALERVTKKYRLAIEEKNVLATLNRVMVVAATRKDAGAIAEGLRKETGIENPQPNYVFTTMGEEDSLQSMQKLATMLDLPTVHGKASGKNVTVAVVDTGVEVDHEDLRARVVGHHNFVPGSAYRGEIHGTAVAGIIAAEHNRSGIVGIAPQVSLLALRACRQVGKNAAVGECLSTSLALSLDTAIVAKAQVVNLSLGAYVDDDLLGKMIDTGHGKGMIFAAPVGNDPNAEKIAFPASHPKVVSVAGLDEQGNPLPNKRLASKADAVAPATHLLVTTPGNNYNFLDGTSLASASATGIIALAVERQVRYPSCLPRFADPPPWGRQVKACLGL